MLGSRFRPRVPKSPPLGTLATLFATNPSAPTWGSLPDRLPEHSIFLHARYAFASIFPNVLLGEPDSMQRLVAQELLP